MATPIFSRPAPQLALQCGAPGQLATPAVLGWRERLLQALNQIRWSRASPAAESVPVGYEALGGLDEHLLADIGAPEQVRERIGPSGRQSGRRRQLDRGQGAPRRAWVRVARWTRRLHRDPAGDPARRCCSAWVWRPLGAWKRVARRSPGAAPNYAPSTP